MVDEFILQKFKYSRSDKMPIKLDMSRDELASLFKDLGYKKGAEIGVERGIYSRTLLSLNPELKLYCIDPLKVYKGYREHVSQEKMDNFYSEVQCRLQNYNYELIRKFSMDAVNDFRDEELDFVYIDGNHDFQNTTNDIAEWSKKVRFGGIIAGHDFNRNKKKDYICHVKDVVHGWTYAHGISPWFITSDKSPSYFWTK